MRSDSGVFEAEYYATYYRDYERQNPDRKIRHYLDAVRRYVPPQEEVRILDLGCAFGKFVVAIEPPWRGYGVDVSEYAIRWAREHAPTGRFEVIVEGRIPFAETFHAITAWDVIEHIPDLGAVAQEVASHLEPGGLFAFVVPVYDGPLGPVVRALDKDPTHVHRMSRTFWLEWTRRHFCLEDWWGVFRYLLPGGIYAHWPTRALRGIAPAVAVMARRTKAPTQEPEPSHAP
jgi:SAM-dependent methyltransferase